MMITHKLMMCVAILVIVSIQLFADTAEGTVTFDKKNYDISETAKVTITANKFTSVIAATTSDGAGMNIQPALATHVGKQSGKSDITFTVPSETMNDKKSVTATFKGNDDYPDEKESTATAEAIVSEVKIISANLRGIVTAIYDRETRKFKSAKHNVKIFVEGRHAPYSPGRAAVIYGVLGVHYKDPRSGGPADRIFELPKRKRKNPPWEVKYTSKKEGTPTAPLLIKADYMVSHDEKIIDAEYRVKIIFK